MQRSGRQNYYSRGPPPPGYYPRQPQMPRPHQPQMPQSRQPRPPPYRPASVPRGGRYPMQAPRQSRPNLQRPRGPAPPKSSRRKVDLSKVDTGINIHQLYVLVGCSPSENTKSRNLTLAILSFVHSSLKNLTKLGIRIKVNKIKQSHLQNQKLINAMKTKGIKRLPALTTSNNVYLGYNEIVDLYSRNMKVFSAFKRREDTPATGMTPEDDLQKFYDQEMNTGEAWDDAVDNEDSSLGESEGLMESYRYMMERRGKQTNKLRPSRKRTSNGQSYGGRSPAPRVDPHQANRSDNIGDDDDIQGVINRLAKSIDYETFDEAFSSGGGESLEDGYVDPENTIRDPQDDLMEAAYWARQELTKM